MERNALVDNLKGYACFLVLFGHVIMGVRQAGVPVPFFFEGLEQFIWSFHVPLFLFLSGVVYELTGRWRGKKTRGRFILHKLLSLGVPYVVFSAVYILVNTVAGGTNTEYTLTDILGIWHTPVAQYWFLYALFFLFCIWALLSDVLPNWVITLLTVAVSYLVPLFGGSLGCFGVVFDAAIAFGLGTCVPFAKLEKPAAPIKWGVVAAHVAAGITLIVLGKIEAPFFKELMLLFGIYAAILLISMVQKVGILARILRFMNRYSFQIYLLHTVFTAGTRIALLRFGITQWWIHVVLGTAAGLGCSTLCAIIAKRIPALNFFFFPTKYLKSR